MVYQQLSYNNHGGIREVLLNRPPTVVFLLCIASCALATMSISFYFKLTNEEVSNRSNKTLASADFSFDNIFMDAPTSLFLLLSDTQSRCSWMEHITDRN